MAKYEPDIGPENYRKRTEREIQEGNRAILAAMEKLQRSAQEAGITEADVESILKEIDDERKAGRRYQRSN